MGKLVFYIILAAVCFIVLAWDSDIKPRIFANPEAVKVKPEIKLGILIYLACFFVAFFLYLALLWIGPDSSAYRIYSGIIVAGLALFFGNHFTKRELRSAFYEASISMHMNPEEYAKTICPYYVVQYIETHLSDKEGLEKYIRNQRKMGHISDPCAWAFLVAYCEKRP